MEENANGTTSMCMLEWLVKKNGKDHYALYYGNGNNTWFLGANDDHTNNPERFSRTAFWWSFRQGPCC